MTRQSAPGSDIGRRLVRRREELGLSRAQVAERAGVAPGYLAYVEEEATASPGLAFLLRVADVLETTVPRLHGAGTELPTGRGEAAGHPVLSALAPEACRELLSGHGVGRLALTVGGAPSILPVNYDVVDGAVVFRTAAGAPALAAGQTVAFEVDHFDEARSEGWSVLVTGPAEQVTDPAGIAALAAAAATTPWAGGDRPTWIRIRPDHITGRRITAG